jgi:hypothetical protein
LSTPVLADCTNPTGQASSINFNAGAAVLQYCNGTDWIAFPKAAGVEPPCSDISAWTARGAAAANTWRSVTYGNSVFVAVSMGGTNSVMTSPDGTTWTARTAAASSVWYSVTYGNGLFVAVAISGTDLVMTSPDGITWTARAAAEANQWRSVTFGNGLFVAVAASGTNRVMTSPDGITWTARTAAEANQWNSVTYGNGLFLAVASTGTNRVMTSPDGITWTAQTGLIAGRSVAYGSGLFVSVIEGVSQVRTSPDGITWTVRTVPEANQWVYVTYGNGIFVAVANSGINRVMTSPDGITWTARAASEENSWNSVTYGNGRFVAVAGDGSNRVMTAECARGECTNPSRGAGTIIFNADRRVMQWCDGALWHPLGPSDPPGPNTGCSDPVRSTGHILFNSSYRVLQYCDGHEWRLIGKFPCKSCGGSFAEKVVFNTMIGKGGRSLGGVTGADAKCQADAEAAGLAGTYKAWIADATTDSAPAVRFNRATVPYVRVDGVIVADDWSDLTDGSLDAVSISETDNFTSGNGIWTNVLPDGTRASALSVDHCDNWDSAGVTGNIGNRAVTNSNWTSWATGHNCAAGLKLYCFEQ